MRSGQRRAGRRLAAAVAIGMSMLGGAMLLAGCSNSFFQAVNNNPTGTGATGFVYITNIASSATGGTLSAYSVNSGTLTALSGSPYTLPETPTSIVVAPNNKFLFVGTQLGVFLYTINADGTLTAANNSTTVYLGPSHPQSLAVDSTSSWLVVANSGSSELDALALDATTGIPNSTSPVTVALNAATPQQVVFSPANNNLFVALGAGGTDGVGFTASSSSPLGKPVNIKLKNGATGINSVTVDPTSTYLYLAEQGTNQLRVIAITNLSTDFGDYPVGKAPSYVFADPTSSYVYVANETDGTLSGFAQSAGTLTALSDSPFATARSPIAIAEDSSRTYLVTIGAGTNPNLYEYTYDTVTAGTLDVKTTATTSTNDPANSNALAMTH